MPGDFLSLELVADFSAAALIAQLLWGKIAQKRFDFIGALSQAVMVGFVGFGIFSYVVRPDPTTNFALIWDYAPHAYNYIIWGIGTLTVLKARFGARLLIPVFLFCYGLSEVLWNSVAILRFYGNAYVLYFVYNTSFNGYWWTFITVCCLTVALTYLWLRPHLRLNWYIPFFVLYCAAYGWVFGIPNETYTAIGLTFELLWQAVMWGLIVTTVFPRVKK